MTETTTIVSWAAAIHHALAAKGVDPNEVFEAAGLDPALLSGAENRYPVSGMSRLWKLAVEATGNPTFALEVPAYVQPGSLHGLGLAAMASESLQDAVRRIERFSRIVSTAAIVHSDESGDPVRVVLEPVGEVANEAFEAFLATMVNIARLMLQQPDLSPTTVQLDRPEGQSRAAFADFFGCDIEYDAGCWAFTVPRAVYSKPLPAHNAALAYANDAVVMNYLGQIDNDIVQKTQRAVIELLPNGSPGLEQVAVRLNRSARSLQRELADADTNYKDLRETVQRELAERWLISSEHSLGEITFQLGFSDQSNFGKAFKRWTGMSPKEYRSKGVKAGEGG